jgi:phospholipid/cholesterol/gamma-HCH transport system substrate-binding protein
MRLSLEGRDPFRIGLVAIAGGAVLGLLVLLVTFVPFGARTYTAVLAQTAGLRVGEDVEVYGVPKGEVRSIELAGDTVRVRFTVDKGIDLGDRTTAAVKVATLLGTHYLAVTPAGGGRLETIPLSRTSVPFNLQDVLEQGTASLEKLDPALLARALTEASRTLSASSDQVGPALTGIARLSEAVQRRSDQTGALLAAARSVTSQLSASSGDLVGLMRQANLVIAEITRRREAIHTLLTETTTLADSLGGIVDQTRNDMAPALRQLNAVLKTLRDEDATLKDVLDKIAPTVRYFANATGNGPWGDLWLKDPAMPPDDVSCRTGGC